MIKYCYWILLSVFLTACTSPPPAVDRIFAWPSSGNAEADSVIVRFERMRSCDRSSGMERLYDRMCALHRAFPRNELIGYRKEYIGIILMRQRNDSTVGHRIITAYNSVDSARYPYDFHMIKALLIPETENVVVRYRLVRECLDYFHRVQSHPEIARMYVEAGHVMFDLRDTIKGVEYSRKAAEIYERLGLYYPYMLSKQNMAVFKGREESGVLFRELRNDARLRKYPHPYALVLLNSFTHTDSVEFLERALECYDRSIAKDENYLLILFQKGKYYNAMGDYTLAIRILRQGIGEATEITHNRKILRDLHFMLADAYREAGMQDSCIQEFDRGWKCNVRLEDEFNGSEVYAMDSRSMIEMEMLRSELERRKIISWSVFSMLVAAAGAGYFILWAKRRKAEYRYKELLMQEKLRCNRRSIIASASVIDETDRVVKEMRDRINSLLETGKLSEHSAGILLNTLGLHKSYEENRRAFLLVNRSLNSRFMTRLKKDYPDLSEQQLNMAAMIACGIDNMQIGRILNIQNTSVHKSRYRLRQCLHLPKSESLEEFLRRYNDRNNDID